MGEFECNLAVKQILSNLGTGTHLDNLVHRNVRNGNLPKYR